MVSGRVREAAHDGAKGREVLVNFLPKFGGLRVENVVDEIVNAAAQGRLGRDELHLDVAEVALKRGTLVVRLGVKGLILA